MFTEWLTKNNFHRNYVKIIEKADGALIRSFEEYLDLRKINMGKKLLLIIMCILTIG